MRPCRSDASIMAELNYSRVMQSLIDPIIDDQA
jgi:hypothetical protein